MLQGLLGLGMIACGMAGLAGLVLFAVIFLLLRYGGGSRFQNALAVLELLGATFAVFQGRHR